ncbi:GntR family transcriptional regulator [Tamaricihabitans halophyticus]|uniref:GntR family transcriptional regulator n=1 Tax=Tamaricihabitans halophyticus TaxID=1262583 RepID=A0A4R2Q4B6_9PSEU|nr:GntR family transcriptional regulator [Tamaricihabitans halophyticus]TCP43440.1 GntR family transcriptional regulator [Tamaricihabitans halophyticus]
MTNPDAAVPPVRNAMSDRVYSLLRARIIDLELQPGARLQIDWCSAEFDVSPTPVREALNRLVAEDLVIAEPYRGFRVSELLDYAELTQLLLAREVIESAAAKQSARVCDEATLGALRAAVDEMAELADADELDVKRFNAADARFHRLIVQSSGNRFLLNAFDSLHAHVQISRHYQGRPIIEAQRSNNDHRRMVEAIARGASDEVALQVTAHIDGVLDRLRSEHDTEGDTQ